MEKRNNTLELHTLSKQLRCRRNQPASQLEFLPVLRERDGGREMNESKSTFGVECYKNGKKVNVIVIAYSAKDAIIEASKKINEDAKR